MAVFLNGGPELLYAPGERNSGGENKLFLSAVDQKLILFAKVLMFYEAENRSDFHADRFKEGLIKVLAHYPFLAGRLRVNNQKRLEVQCNNAGVMFATSAADHTVQDILTLNSSILLADFFVRLPDAKRLSEIPLLLLQVSYLSSGGLALGFAVNHTLMDIESVTSFVNNYMSIVANTGHCLFPPSFDREVLKARVVREDDTAVAEIENTLVAKIRDSENPSRLQDGWIREAFQFPVDKLEKLKKLVTGDVNTKCTSFEALAAHTWRTYASCFPESDKIHALDMVVNFRDVFHPPLPENFCGNAAFAMNCATMVNESDTRASDIVHCIAASKAKMGDATDMTERIRKFMDFMELVPLTRDLEFSSLVLDAMPWSVRGLYDLDFGCGKPVWVEIPLWGSPRDLIFFYPTSSGGDVGVSVSLPQGSASAEKFKQLIFIE